MSQSEMVNTSDLWLTIPNPDNPSFAPPIYEGNGDDVHKYLRVGTYKAVISNMMTGLTADLNVYVGPRSTTFGRYCMGGKA